MRSILATWGAVASEVGDEIAGAPVLCLECEPRNLRSQALSTAAAVMSLGRLAARYAAGRASRVLLEKARTSSDRGGCPR